ncbi:MAG TPA: glutathione S-transferase N-terminal domain-containing protein [Pseudomonadales bacterium]|nr:glutathione S-transferase N-terminal domain-containing protein [Pseudomonadales bacterium]
MIDLYYAPTPNGWKVSIMLEECGLPYRTHLLNLGAGDQFSPDFLALSPNNRMPAIVDDEAPDRPLSIFESGAILVYLAEKAGRFLPTALHERFDALQWVFWQVGGLGPMAGQLSHFVNYAPGGPAEHAYSHERYAKEYDRLIGVMERSLAQREWLGGADYGIADMATWPWLVPYKRFEQDIDQYPHVRRWFDAIKARPAVRAGMDVGKEARRFGGTMTDAQRRIMFGQTGRNLDDLKGS